MEGVYSAKKAQLQKQNDEYVLKTYFPNDGKILLKNCETYLLGSNKYALKAIRDLLLTGHNVLYDGSVISPEGLRLNHSLRQYIISELFGMPVEQVSAAGIRYKSKKDRFDLRVMHIVCPAHLRNRRKDVEEDWI